MSSGVEVRTSDSYHSFDTVFRKNVCACCSTTNRPAGLAP
jgi:hypothetical protein